MGTTLTDREITTDDVKTNLEDWRMLLQTLKLLPEHKQQQAAELFERLYGFHQRREMERAVDAVYVSRNTARLKLQKDTFFQMLVSVFKLCKDSDIQSKVTPLVLTFQRFIHEQYDSPYTMEDARRDTAAELKENSRRNPIRV